MDVPKVVKGSEARGTLPTPGLKRMAGIDASVGSHNLFVGVGSTPPHTRSAPHHHGEAATAGYILQGRCWIYYGEDFKQCVEAGPGDFIYMPPFVPHIEANESDDECVGVVTRTPSNIVINLDE